jgi:hypothetical protein
MREYFILSNSFAAPFFSDQGTSYIMAENPADALNSFVASYKHPCGLYSANCYESADAYHKGDKQLAQWLCNVELGKQRLTKDLPGGYSIMGHGPGEFEINHERHVVENPKEGRVV